MGNSPQRCHAGSRAYLCFREALKDNGNRRSAETGGNVAQLPGIVRYSLAMPDMHWGYGFPIGGVAAFDLEGGVVSPGGVGYDINCGCRLVTTRLHTEDIKKRLSELVTALFHNIPSGVGSKGNLKLSGKGRKKSADGGGSWAVQHGYGTAEDLDNDGKATDASREQIHPW